MSIRRNPADDHTEPRQGVVVPFPASGRHLPDRPRNADVEPAEAPIEGEIVTEDEYQQRTGLQRYTPTVLVRVVHVVRQSETTTHAGRATLRAGVTIGQGFGSWVHRVHDAATLGVYRREIQAAEAAGDQERLVDWTIRREQAKKERHQRLMDTPKEIVGFAIVCGVSLAGLVVVILLVGLLTQVSGAGEFLGVLSAVLGGIRFVFDVVPVAVTVGGLALPPALLWAAWLEGKRRGNLPTWLVDQPGGGDVMDGLPDEGTIVKALHNLNIPGFNKALKGGWVIRFRLQPTMDGKGYRVQLDLPPACPVEEIVKRKPMLAHNLLRFPIEVWPTEPQPGVLDLWIANPGVLSGPVDPWPLLDDLDNATADYFAGVPVGITIKGDVVRGRLFEANYVVGGMMGSGKSTMVITLLAGAMLDPLVDIDVIVMADNADYDPMEPRLRTLVTGAGEDTVETCMGMLRELYDELSIRGQALREHDARAVIRKLAQDDERLRPRIMVIDECQNLFLGQHGKDALEAASKLMSTARKYAITLMFLTPEPSKDALPRKLITITSNKACFAIGDQQSNDAVLGTGSYKQGISAVGLTPKTDEGPGDVGTCMARGFMAKPGLLRSFYIPQDDMHRVTQRGMQLRAERGIRTTTAAIDQEERDLLEDLDEVLGDDPLPIADVPPLLARLAPRWAPYRHLTGVALRQRLAKEGIKVPSTKNRYPLDPLTVREALAKRATADLDDGD